MPDVQWIGKRIRELRCERGLTQGAFAEALGVSFQAVSNWERGIAPPELENLVRVASYFGVLVDELLRPSQEELYLGIDGGGSKTELVLVSSDGSAVRRLLRGGCNPNDIGFSAMLSLLCEAIDTVRTEHPSIKAIFLGLAGITVSDLSGRLRTELRRRYPQIKMEIQGDAFNLFALDERADMVLISGTGSVVFVRHGDGYRRLGGWGYLLDRAGSAYDVGRDALGVALHEEDMGLPPSLMSRLLRERLGAATVWERINTVYAEGRPFIAGLASVVFDAYREGDAGAIAIVDRTAEALASLLEAGVTRYGVKPQAVASGGLLSHYTDILTTRIAKYTDVELNVSPLPPVFGACRRACLLGGCTLSEEFSERFQATYGGICK